MGTGVEHGGFVGCALLFQFMLIDQNDVTGSVVEHGGPLASHVQVHRAVAGQVQTQGGHVSFHHIKVVSVLLQVHATVDDVDRVGVAGDGDGKAATLGGIDSTGAGTEVELVLVNVTGLQVDHGQSAGFAITDEQAAGEFSPVLAFVPHSMFSMFVSFGEGQFHELHRFQALRGDHPDRARGGGVGDQVFHLIGEPCAVADDHGRLRDAHAVSGRALPDVGIGAGAHQRVHLHQIGAHLVHQICEQDVSGHHLEGLALHGAFRR